jgi:hypothetical protein
VAATIIATAGAVGSIYGGAASVFDGDGSMAISVTSLDVALLVAAVAFSSWDAVGDAG